MDVESNKMEVGKLAARVSPYVWFGSGVMLLAMLEAIYRDTLYQLPRLDLSLGGCFKFDIEGLSDFSVTGTVDLDYSDSTYLPTSATPSINFENVLSQVAWRFFFDSECTENIFHPIGEAILYGAMVATISSVSIFAIEMLSKRNHLAKGLSAYVWLLGGVTALGMFDGLYRNTMHELPALDLSLGGCFVVAPGDYPTSLDPNVIELSYDSEHYPPQSANFQVWPMREVANYQPTALFRRECIAQITKPFGRGLERCFFIALGLCTFVLAMEQWVRVYGWTLPCRGKTEELDVEHQRLNTEPPSDESKERSSSADGDIELGRVNESLVETGHTIG